MTMPKVPVVPTPENHKNQALLILNGILDTESPEEATALTTGAIAHALLGLLDIEIRKAKYDGLDIA